MSKPLLKPTETTNSEPETDNLDWTEHNNCAHIPNAETIAAIEETEQLINALKNGEKPENLCVFKSVEDMFKELDKR